MSCQRISIISFCLLMLCAGCNSKTPVRRCSEDLPFPLNVQIDECEDLPCPVTKGTSLKMEVQFVAIKDETHHIETEVLLTVRGITVPYQLPAENGIVCKNLMFGANCPLYAEEDVTFSLDFPIDNNLVETNVKTEVRLRDTEKDVVACYIFDMKVRR